MALTKINASVIANNTIAVGNIADNSVDATKIASNSILTRHIDDDQITGDQLADNISIAGTLTSTGAFTSPGIDDNADATAITIDSSEKVFVNGGVNITTTAGNTNLQVLTTNSQAADLGGSIGMGGVYNATNQITFAEIHGKKTNSTAANVHGYMAFVTRGDNIAERMRIDSLGNVGIGTASPTSYSAYADNLVVAGAGETGITIASGNSSQSGLYFSDGTSGTEQYIGFLDYNHSSNTLIIGTSGTQKAAFNQYGLGIGSASSAGYIIEGEGTGHQRINLRSSDNNTAGIYLQVKNSGNMTGNATLRTDSSGNFSIWTGTTSESQKVTVDASGKVGIGTTSPGQLLDISHDAGSHNAVLRLTGTHGSAYAAGLEWYSGYGPKVTAQMFSTASGSLGGEWWLNVRNQNTNGQYRVMSIDNVGRLRLGGVSAACSGAFNIMGEFGNSYDAIQFYHNSATLVGRIRTAASSTSYLTSSDYRLKENIDYSWDATTRLKQLKPARFNWIKDDTNTLLEGFLAHEVSSIVPEAVSGEKDAVDDDNNPDYQGIDHSKLVPLMVKTIQELEARIKTLEG